MICPQCESYVSDNMAFCPFCGYKVNPDLVKKPVDKSAQSKLDINTTDFFGSKFDRNDDGQDFGHIASAIESPQTEDTEDFSEKIQSTLTEIIGQSAGVATTQFNDEQDFAPYQYNAEQDNSYPQEPAIIPNEIYNNDSVESDDLPDEQIAINNPESAPIYNSSSAANSDEFFSDSSIEKSFSEAYVDGAGTSHAENNASQDEYQIRRSFYPDEYPIVDLSSLPANDVYNEHQREIQNGARQPEYIDRSHMGEFDEYDFEFTDSLDNGPDLLGELRSSKEQFEDESTVSLSDIFKKTKNSVSSLFKKKHKKESEEKQPFVVNIEDDDLIRPQPVVKNSSAPAVKTPRKATVKENGTAAVKFVFNKKLLPYFIAAAAVILLVLIIIIASSSSGNSYSKELFPEIYYDNGKLVLLKSDRPEDKHNIDSSGIESIDDVDYFSEAGFVYYVKNNDLYCYTIKKLESMRIVRNVYDYVFIDGGEKLCAVSTDGKVYFFNGKDIAALSKANDAVRSDSLPFVYGDNFECALYLDEYSSAEGSAMIHKVDKGGKDKTLFQSPEGTKNIELLHGKYIMLTDKNGDGTLYDIDGNSIAVFEKYDYSIELGTDSLLIYYKDGTYALFAKKTIDDLSEEIAEIVEVSETDDKFCYKTADGMCYIYDNGKTLNIGDVSVYQKFICNVDENVAYGLEEDVLIYYNISSKTKSAQVADGITDFMLDENSGTWMAMGDSSVYRLNESDCTEIYPENTANYPTVSSDGKSYLLLNNAGELVLINGDGEQIIAEDVAAFDCDSSFDDIIFVCNDKLYLNQIENRVTTVRDLGSFEFCESK